MKRVASLYLPDWPIDRLRRAERTATPPDATPSWPPSDALETLTATAAEEQRVTCSVPRGGGWRPGARWARAEREAQIAALPAHQRPPMRELGRREEAMPQPFRALRSDDGGTPTTLGAEPHRSQCPPRLASTSPARPPRHTEEDLAPVVTAIRDGNRQIVAAVCPVARSRGVAPGMALTQVRAQFVGLDIRDADPVGDATDLERLAVALARRWSPLVAIEGADGLFLDLTGTAHLFGGEARMARRLVRLLARLGFTARIGIADTTGAAWALARADVGDPNTGVHSTRQIRGTLHRDPSLYCDGAHGEDDGIITGDGFVICPPGAQVDAIAPLPCTALRLDPAHIELLKRLGVDRIGQLAKIARGPLVRRFGKEIVARLDQASGRVAEPLDPIVPPDPIVVSQRFAEPIATAEVIEYWLGVLMPRLVAVLAEAGQGARLVELVADRVDGVPQTVRIGLARPTRDSPHLLRLIVRRIEEIAPGYGIDALHLHVRRADLLDAQPFDERLEEKPTDLAPLVDTLANRISGARLWRMKPVESDVPERSLEAAPPLDPPPRDTARLKRDDVRLLDTRAVDHPWHHRWPRPVRLLRRPELLDHVLAELPDQPPRRFTWRGEAHRVVRADGPERILGEWWKHAGEGRLVRDYFQVEDERGQRFWLFRRGDGERAETGDLTWFMHGAFG